MTKDKFLQIARQMRAAFPNNNIRAKLIESDPRRGGPSIAFRVWLDPHGFPSDWEKISWSRDKATAEAKCDKYNQWLKEAGITKESQHCPERAAMLLAALGPPPDTQ